MRRFRSLAVLAIVALPIALAPRAAWAHGDMDEPDVTPTAVPEMNVHLKPAHLELRMPKEIRLGSTVTITAVLEDDHGMPIAGGTVAFERPAFWGDGMSGHMLVGEVMTDKDGMAVITDRIRTSGDVDIEATFVGDAVHREAMAEESISVLGDVSLYQPSAGLNVPWLNLWILAGVIALVWGLYLVVGARLVAIARSPVSAGVGEMQPATAAPPTGTPEAVATRRQFLARLLPFGAEAGIGMVGATLVGIVARSPRTHGNLMSVPATEAAYDRTPVAFVGMHADMRAMPMPLEREVSFSREVLPILLANGGPHVVQPKNSPPPGGFRLDSYANVMTKDGVVVPGKPDESEMVEHLLSPAMQMPPSLPPLPMDDIQLVVTWIAQGAKDN
jgi:hypothetical protein